MSWFFKSLQSHDVSDHSPPPFPPSRSPGVKDEFSVIGETIGRQLRGVANFLAPPPPAGENKLRGFDEDSGSSSQTLEGIRNDLAEIGGSLKNGLSSLLSTNKAVTEISKFTSNFISFHERQDGGDDDDEDYVPGITEEVVDFVEQISTRPEYWNDFPISLQDDFRMSEAQREHALAIEQLVPGLAGLRANLAAGRIGSAKFWLVYFMLLLPRLSEHDSQLLSTPQILETRNILLQKLHNKRSTKAADSSEVSNASPNTSQEGSSSSKVGEKQEENITCMGGRLKEIVSATEGLAICDEEITTGQWLEDTDNDTGTSEDNRKKLERKEEDVSFSDLEDDENDHLSSRLSASREPQGVRAPSPSGSSDWVQLNESSESRVGSFQKARQSTSRDKDSDAESNDWLKVDDFD